MNGLKKLLWLLILGCLFAPLANAQITLDFFSDPAATTQGRYSNNSAWPTDGTFKFRLGTFGTFTPTSLNVADWNSNWTSISGAFNPTDWIDDGGDLYFAGSGSYATNAGDFAVGNKIYIWGYNNQAFSSGNEWILIGNSTDPDWSFKDYTTGPSTLSLNVSLDSGLQTILGSGAGGATLQSAAVPEPATWALLAASLTITTLLRRRVRRF